MKDEKDDESSVHIESALKTNSNEGEVAKAFLELYRIVKRLRAPDGCPWDREQTPRSMRPGIIEEAYELVEAIDEDDPPMYGGGWRPLSQRDDDRVHVRGGGGLQRGR